MKLKIIFLALFFCFLTILQWNFFSRLTVFGVVPNVVLIFFCLFSFFEKSQEYSLAKIAVLVGFLVDIFFNNFFGLSAILYLLIYFFIKGSLNFLLDVSKKYSIVYFVLIFSVSLIVHGLFLGIFRHFYSDSSWLIWGSFNGFLIQVVYNLVWSIVFFYLLNLFPSIKKNKI